MRRRCLYPHETWESILLSIQYAHTKREKRSKYNITLTICTLSICTKYTIILYRYKWRKWTMPNKLTSQKICLFTMTINSLEKEKMRLKKLRISINYQTSYKAQLCTSNQLLQSAVSLIRVVLIKKFRYISNNMRY